MRDPEKTSTTPASYLEAGTRTLASIVFAVVLIIYGIHALLALTYPYPLDYGEARSTAPTSTRLPTPSPTTRRSTSWR